MKIFWSFNIFYSANKKLILFISISVDNVFLEAGGIKIWTLFKNKTHTKFPCKTRYDVKNNIKTTFQSFYEEEGLGWNPVPINEKLWNYIKLIM